MTDFVSIIGGISGVIADVDTDRRAFLAARPPAFGIGGSYRQVQLTQIVTQASLGAGTNLMAFTWSTPNVALIQAIKVGIVVATAITTGVQFDLSALYVRGLNGVPFVGAAAQNDFTAGSTHDPQGALRTSMPRSLQMARVNAANGVEYPASIMNATAGTTSPSVGYRDTLPGGNTGSPFGYIQGFSGTAIGTQFYQTLGGLAELYVRDDADAYPIVLAAGDGINLRSVQAGPATGSWALTVQLEWAELPQY